jgi:RNase P subunit RPR2
MEAYCVKCKAKREMKDPTAVTMKNGKPATSGTCTTCGTKMFQIGSGKK